MTPQTTAQNLLIWAAAFTLAVLLSFLSGIATHWPDGGPIDWRGVALDVIQTILTTAPLVAAGFGLPRLGKESIAGLVSSVGKGPAQAALEVEAIKQASGDAPTPETADLLADRIYDRIAAKLIAPAGTDDPRQPEQPVDHIIGPLDADERAGRA